MFASIKIRKIYYTTVFKISMFFKEVDVEKAMS